VRRERPAGDRGGELRSVAVVDPICEGPRRVGLTNAGSGRGSFLAHLVDVRGGDVLVLPARRHGGTATSAAKACSSSAPTRTAWPGTCAAGTPASTTRLWRTSTGCPFRMLIPSTAPAARRGGSSATPRPGTPAPRDRDADSTGVWWRDAARTGLDHGRHRAIGRRGTRHRIALQLTCTVLWLSAVSRRP
jgi:hypothetical protein